MMDVQLLNLHSIVLEQGLKYSQIVNSFAIVLYQRTQLNKIQALIKRKCPQNQAVALISQGQHFWLVKACQEENEVQYEQIERLVGLSQSIVCIDLSNSIESFVQKVFWSNKNQSSAYSSNNKLIFIKDIYNNKLNSSDILYFHSIQQAETSFCQKSLFSCSPLTIADILQLMDIQKPENISKVKAIYRKYEQIRKSEQKMSSINDMIFSCQKSKAEIFKEIEKLNLPKFQQDKFLWKIKQMQRYREWLEEEKHSHQLNCSKLTFHQLNERLGYTLIFRYQKQWTTNSLLRLKLLFNKINGLNDTGSIKDFQREYNSMRDNLEKIQKRLQKTPESSLFQEMIYELDSFFSYHQAALNNSTFSSLAYVKGEAKYIWKYKNNIYKKVGAFVLFGGLAYCQHNFLRAATFTILAILILTLRC